MSNRLSEQPVKESISVKEMNLIDAYWRAANYLSIGQIYLLDNPLLNESLQLKHIKPRLLGHWGTTPGLNFIYAHLNRVIKKYDLDMIYICGPHYGYRNGVFCRRSAALPGEPRRPKLKDSTRVSFVWRS